MLPYVVIHNEMSLDARMDGLDVDMGRFYTLAGTWREDCTLVGSETLLAGMPELGDPAEPGAGAGTAVAPMTTERRPTRRCWPQSTRAGGCLGWAGCATSRTGAM